MFHIMKHTPSIRIIVSLCVFFLICSCAASAKRATIRDPKELYTQAQSEEKSGNLQEASRTYTLLWKTYPGNELAPDALYRAAGITAALDPGTAVDLYRSFLASYPDSPLQPRVIRSLLENQIKLGEIDDAYRVFTQAFSPKHDPKLVQPGVRLVQGSIYNKQYSKAIDLTCLVFPHADVTSQNTLLTLWKSAVSHIDQIDALEELEDKVSDDRLREVVLAWEAKLYLEQGNQNIAQGIISRLGPGKVYSLWPEQGLRGVKSTVGVLLPLSRKWESVGRKALKGIEHASRVFSSQTSPNVEYLIRDYGDDEQSIPAIIEQLDTRDKVIALIGPIGESAGGIACREAQRRGIPSLIFTRTESEPKAESYCFHNFVSVDIQVEALLKAAAARNITRFAVLYPGDNFGKVFTNTFVRKAGSYGIEIVRQTEYPADATNFKGIVQNFVKAAPRRTPGKPGAAASGYQAVLVPDTAINAGMIATYLTYYKVKGVRLFGPTLWDTPDFVRVGGDSVEDAIFVSGFYAGSRQKNVQEFIEDFSSTFGYNPSLWEATAFDSATILQNLAGLVPTQRKALQSQLSSVQDYPGLTGRTSFRKNGSVEKIIYVLTIQNSKVAEIVP